MTLYFEEHCENTLLVLGLTNEKYQIPKSYHRRCSSCLFRTYSYLNLLDLAYIKTSLDKEEDYFIEEDTILSTYKGHTMFSIFLQKFEVYEHIYN